jgi:hypothetical protein
MQLVDELSMIYTACLMCYATFSFSQSRVFRQVLGTGLLSLAAFITVSRMYQRGDLDLRDTVILSLFTGSCFSPKRLCPHYCRCFVPVNVCHGSEHSAILTKEVRHCAPETCRSGFDYKVRANGKCTKRPTNNQGDVVYGNIRALHIFGRIWNLGFGY